MAKLVLPHVLPSRPASDLQEDPRTVVTIFFGANDAALHDRTSSKQHVPLDVYTVNVRSMVAYLKQEAKIRNIIMITPPPVSEPHRVAHAKRTYGIDLPLGSERTVEATSKYAAACKDLAAELNVPCVDLFSRFMAVDGYGDVLLNDGLHLTPRGNALVAEALVEVLQGLELGPDDIEVDVPLWDAMLPCDGEGLGEDLLEDVASKVLREHLASRPTASGV
jgi:lysophospholipase L1-like esterase